ncbi:hypothetical protein NB640_04250 [Oxalobacter vibrioformis]|uniref:Uncharacterized protein n=1 Tax=Oxalobacter vibrioformis TaxID=933080 RepID=A0A9E9LXU8_9BURK|nr:hypothetical protein [Oxalobacter vibrioformis]WAW10864.1 hypothetical protein NB640_04250 [Oxalobacter vibrioformis]
MKKQIKKSDAIETKIKALQQQLVATKKHEKAAEERARLDALIAAARGIGLLEKSPDEIRQALKKLGGQADGNQ